MPVLTHYTNTPKNLTQRLPPYIPRSTNDKQKRRPVGVNPSAKPVAKEDKAADDKAAKKDSDKDSKPADEKPKLPDVVFSGFETRSIHAGASPCPTTGACVYLHVNIRVL